MAFNIQKLRKMTLFGHFRGLFKTPPRHLSSGFFLDAFAASPYPVCLPFSISYEPTSFQDIVGMVYEKNLKENLFSYEGSGLYGPVPFVCLCPSTHPHAR